MKQLVKKIWDYEIYYDDGRENTVPNSSWIVATPSGVSFYYDGNKSLEEIEEIVKRLKGKTANTC